jgi:hypothetical protein
LSFPFFLFLHNISWITLTSSHFHFREGSSSHKKISFPLFSCFLFRFSIHCFPSGFFRFSVSFSLFVFSNWHWHTVWPFWPLECFPPYWI